MLAYTLGMRHAFDADHIAAIDNTTRKLMGEGKRPLSVGFWFSLGHSTIVFGWRPARTSASQPGRPGQQRQLARCTTTGSSAPCPGVFLYLIGIINLVVLVGIIRVFREMRARPLRRAELEPAQQPRAS